MPNHPLVNTDFEKWIGTKFAKYLLPIIPAGAAISEDSKLNPKELGKTPGNWRGQQTNKNEWSGFSNGRPTTSRSVTAIKRWHGWQNPDQAGVPIASALNSIVLIGFDGDSDDPLVIKWMCLCMESTRLSKVAASKKLTGEIKGGRVGIEFTNTTKLSIVGNHRPHIQSGLTGGLTSRMLLFEAGGKNYRSREGMVGDLGMRIVNEEGPQLLAYIIWQAHLDYIDITTNNGADWDRLMKPLHESAQTYTLESSFVHEWAEARFMVEDESLEILTMQAYNSFVAYAKEWGENTAKRIKLPEFKDTLKAAFRSIKIRKSHKHETSNRSAVIGFGQRVDAFGDQDKVAVLDHFRQPTPAK